MAAAAEVHGGRARRRPADLPGWVPGSEGFQDSSKGVVVETGCSDLYDVIY